MHIRDLRFFRRVGRCAPAAAMTSSVITHNATTKSTEATSEGPYLLENYCNTERPLLQRLRLCQSSCLDHSTKQEDSLAPWREQLRFKFRFLSELTLARETDPDLNSWKKKVLWATIIKKTSMQHKRCTDSCTREKSSFEVCTATRKAPSL